MTKPKLGIIMDDINQVIPEKDTGFAMMLEAARRGYEIFYIQQHDLYSDNGKIYAYCQQVTVKDQAQDFYHLESKQTRDLSTLNVILMRKDPPFDLEYIYTTYMLEQLENQNVLIVNKPQSLRDLNEKFTISQYAQFCAPTLITKNKQKIINFSNQHNEVVIKPLNLMGGESIFRVKNGDPNLEVILDTISKNQSTTLMIQKFIPEVTQGDKRILIINGTPYPYALARIPKDDKSRANLAAGGTGIGQALSERDLEIANTIAPMLKEKGVLFAGLDIIGDYLTEINVTSPTCVRQLDAQYNDNILSALFDVIETKINFKIKQIKITLIFIR
ncbi:glutathione synthase [Piscirickettsia litoralis]|uniref:Glutathione synthetase n=1 Tax=Piscirickettsia litoralis TaxID=1891921 RepID=A0ABX3A5W6_9GAMM|nr:glutathione synthase [Piscirickettsia litoralis]ODN43086.1 glutathione synthase [Piscirickettsia litoralis]